MRPTVTGASAVLLAIVMIATCVSIVPDSSAAPAVHDAEYGAVIALSTDDFYEALTHGTGHDFQYYVDKLNDRLEHYHINTLDPNLKTEVSVRRDVTVDGYDYTAVDRYTGYIEVLINTDVSGQFPNAGTYYAKDGEDTLQFVYRIFGQNGAPSIRDTQMHMDLRIYFDITIETHVDLYTNEMTDSYISVKLDIHDKEHDNMRVHLVEDDEGHPVSMTISYDESNVDSMLYTDIEVGLTMDGMVTDSGGTTWDLKPVVTERIYKSVVSSDLADSMLKIIIQYAGSNLGSTALPELIVKLLTSGSRMLDVFDTIKSLTSSDIPDIAFTSETTGSRYNDGTYDYFRQTSHKDAANNYDFPWNGYIINMTTFVNYFPDDVISAEDKVLINGFITFLGWNHIDVWDLSGHEETRTECDRIRNYVTDIIESDEVTNYHTPQVYIYIAWGGIIATAAVIVLMWRRII